jgi:hypothetical protein
VGRRLKHAHEVLWISNGPWVNQVAPFEKILAAFQIYYCQQQNFRHHHRHHWLCYLTLSGLEKED